jgi:hypothetical protein
MTVSDFKGKNGYEIDGEWYPRVTSICGIIEKPGLKRWLAMQGALATMKRRKITDWGTLIHENIEKILAGKNPKIRDDIRPSINAFLEWKDSHKFKVDDIEKRIVSKKYFYSGTLDVLAEIDDKFGVLDLKTSKDIWDDHFVQTSAYLHANNEAALKRAKTHWILRIDQYQECVLCEAELRNKNGNVEIRKQDRNCTHKWSPVRGVCELREAKDHKIYFNTFLKAKNKWEDFNKNFLTKIENYPNRGNV